jgi:hypothetical protein
MPETANNLADKVDYKIPEYVAMAPDWELVAALQGGTRTMREEGVKYLPQEEKEKNENYQRRLARSVLTNTYGDTTRSFAAGPFAKTITLESADTLDDSLKLLEEDTDRERTTLTQLGKKLFEIAMDHGLVHLLIDFPTMKTDENGQIPLDKYRGMHPRAIFIPVSPSNVIGWRSKLLETGERKLTQLRVYEQATRESGKYGSTNIDRVRVWTETTLEVFEKTTDETNYVSMSIVNHTFGRIPLLTGYLKSNGFMQGKPPLLDLAWLNLAHWQSASDQRNLLRFARTGMLFLSGISQQDVDDNGGLVLGPHAAFRTANEEAKMTIVESGGKSIEAGRQDLQDLENRMHLIGLRPLTQKSGGETATGRAIDEGKSINDVQAWIRTVEALLTAAFSIAAEWEKKKLPKGFAVNIFNEFGLTQRVSEDLKILLEMRIARQIDQETYLREVIRRRLISEDTTPEAIITRLDEEPPDLTGVNVDDVIPDDDDDEPAVEDED